MNNYQLQQRLETIQKEAEIIKQALNNCFPSIEEAEAGAKLEGGWIVVEKYNGAALLAAPQNTAQVLSWNDRNKVLEGLPGDCFIPSVEKLMLAYKNVGHHFSPASYWSSAEASATNACYVRFNSDIKFTNGVQFTSNKTTTRRVRAFRFVVF